MNLFHFEYQGKSARVMLSPLAPARPKPHTVQKTSAGEIRRLRVLNGLTPGLEPTKLAAKDIINDDPELDLPQAGQRLEVELTAAYFDPAEAKPRPIGDFRETDVIYDVTGQEKERRPHLVRTPNLDTLHPIKVGKRFPVADALTQFVFRNSFQLVHQDGLTLDFLYQLAKDLHDKKEMAFLGAGPKGNQPLVLRDRGNPFRAFLYGEIGSGQQADQYKLIVLLSDQELKKPAVVANA
jgi:hypothetical protein